MVYEIKNIKNMPGGFAAATTPEGKYCPIESAGFVTPMHHPKFYDMIESFTEYLPDDFPPGSIYMMLGIFRRDNSASIYTNEDILLEIDTRVKNDVQKGQIVRKKDIADIRNVHLNIEIPNDAGFFFIFHVGWMRCFFYDYCPVLPNKILKEHNILGKRKYDISQILGICYRWVFFRHILDHSDTEWGIMFKNGWFPFFNLDIKHLNLLKSFWAEGLNTDEIIGTIATDLENRLPELLETWRKYESFADFHDEDLSHAVEYFLNDDHRGCGHILYLKIEGIMRSDYMLSRYREEILGDKETKSPRANKLHEFATTISDVSGLLLPDKFKKYLKDVIFRWSDIEDKEAKPTRHSVGHGFPRNWTKETSVIAFLTFEQLMRFIMERQWEIEEK